MRIFIGSMLFMISAFPSAALAFPVKERITGVDEEVVDQSILTLHNGEIRTLPATVMNADGMVVVTAELESFNSDVQIAAVIKTVSGMVTGTPFRELGGSGSIDPETDKSRSEVLTRMIEEMTEELNQLQGEFELLNAQKRIEAGLGDIDRIADRAEWSRWQASQVKRQMEALQNQ